MGKINSNLFDLDLKKLIDTNDDEIVNNMDDKINIEEVYKNYSETLSSESKSMREKLSVEAIEFKNIEITKENFAVNQYEILKHHNIALDIDGDIYNFITPGGIIYKVSDHHLINIIMATPRPRKITYDLPCITSSVYSMQLLANILENIKSNNISELITSYGYEYTDNYNALNYLACIFPIYEELIYKYQYNNYINKENKTYSIFKKVTYNRSKEKYDKRVEVRDNEISELCQRLQIDTISDYNELDFLKYVISLENNSLIYPSLNAELLDSIGFTDYSKLIELLSEKKFIETVNNNTLVHDTYYNGCIKSSPPLIAPYTNKIVISGSYMHLSANIVAEIVDNPKYIQYINDDKNIIDEILASKNISYKQNTLILLEWALFAYIGGCKTIEDYKLYFFTKKNTVLCDEDVSSIVTLLNEELNELIELIDNTSSCVFKDDSLILHGDFTSFNKLILNIQRKLTKTLISEVYDYIVDFNSKNKSQINFIGYYNYTIYLECEEGSLSVSLDTLTRTMVRVYDKYLRKTKASCMVETLNI